MYRTLRVNHVYEQPVEVEVETAQPVVLESTGDDVKDLVREVAIANFGIGEWDALEELIMRESSWRHDAINPSSGACGLFQALPCSKIRSMAIEDQIDFGMNYIKRRYGTPSNALSFHDSRNWY